MNAFKKPHDQVVLVTGAASGIGAAIVRRFLEKGFRVCATDSHEEKLNLLGQELSVKFEKSKLILQIMDVASRDSVQEVHDTLYGNKEWGVVDILINNAGIFSQTPFLEMKEEEFLKILNVNLLGVFRVSQIFGREMVQKKEGKMIHISSIAAQKGAANAGHYAASKAAVVALSKTMALEFASYNVQVNTILPGYIETEMMKNYKEVLRKLATWRIPGKKLGLPWEVAELVVSIASSEASYLTGSEIVIDGGYSLG